MWPRRGAFESPPPAPSGVAGRRADRRAPARDAPPPRPAPRPTPRRPRWRRGSRRPPIGAAGEGRWTRPAGGAPPLASESAAGPLRGRLPPPPRSSTRSGGARLHTDRRKRQLRAKCLHERSGPASRKPWSAPPTGAGRPTRAAGRSPARLAIPRDARDRSRPLKISLLPLVPVRRPADSGETPGAAGNGPGPAAPAAPAPAAAAPALPPNAASAGPVLRAGARRRPSRKTRVAEAFLASLRARSPELLAPDPATGDPSTLAAEVREHFASLPTLYAIEVNTDGLDVLASRARRGGGRGGGGAGTGGRGFRGGRRPGPRGGGGDEAPTARLFPSLLARRITSSCWTRRGRTSRASAFR